MLARGVSPPGEANLNEKALLVGWATPAARDYRTANLWTYEERGGGKKGEQLPNQAKLAGWATPTASEKRRSEDFAEGRTISPQEAIGTMSSGSTAETGKTAQSQLNPRFSLWLQGYPAEWASCGGLGTRLSRKSRLSSSSRAKKPSKQKGPRPKPRAG